MEFLMGLLPGLNALTPPVIGRIFTLDRQLDMAGKSGGSTRQGCVA